MLLSKKILILFFLLSITAFSQEKITLSGTVYDNKNNETLIGVSIYFPEINIGTTTNQYGFYSITIPKGNYQVQVSYLGFSTIVASLKLLEKTTKNFKLKEATESLDEIVLETNIEKLNIRTPQMSVNKLSSATIKQIPVVLGEADIIKSLILLPGVTSAGEGASGFNVRGGAADQNLILLDEAIVFNSSHLFGFFSVFNPDAIKDVKLYKGGIPAKYGGRVSSVLDIYQKEGNSKDFKASGGIGLVSSRLLLEGPLEKERGAFLIGGRASYAHLFLALTGNENKAYFYDLNTKLNYKINDKNSIYLSGYFGRDLFGISDSFINVYGNSVANFRWNHLFSDKLFSNMSLIYSDYYYGLELDLVGFQWDSGIQNFNFKHDFKYYLSSDTKLNFGLNNIYYRFNPGEIKPNRSDSGIVRDKLTDKYANEFATYIDVEQNVSEALSVQYGLRWSRFDRLGQELFYSYENNEAVSYDPIFDLYSEATPTGQVQQDRNTSIATFNHLEPRLGVSYLINGQTSVKASYNRMAQYLHLLSNTSSPTPLDVWTPSGPFVKPQLLDQFALGYFKNINQYSIETEVFYKEIANRIDYIDGANLIANDAIERVVLNGEARAYGLEFLLKKNSGAFTGWLAYTWSKSEQRTPGRNAMETGINQGNWYVTPFDKTHDLSINTSYELSDKWQFNANFLFQTGQPTNYPVGQYELRGLNVPIFGLRNQERLPAYHRLDISATLIPQKNKGRKFQSEWSFGIYNLYNRRNAASINFRQNADTGNNEALRTSIFGIVPSATYNFKF